MVFIVVTNADEFVLSAVQQVLDDFQVNSSVSNAARQVASTFLEWAKTADNKGKLKEFCDEIIRNLETVFINTIKCRHTGSVVNRDKLWKNFFLLRSSTSYQNKWKDFVEPILPEISSSALFYQRVTDVLFRLLIKSHYQIANNDEASSTLNDLEANALRYAAGFVCRHLRNKIERSSHHFKEELVLCLMTLVKGVQYQENSGTNEEWIDLVDRGGLWHVRENTFHFFCALEEEVQLQLKQLAQSAYAARKKMLQAIAASEDVQFYWLIVTADFEDNDDEIKSIFLSMISELYLTMRGFSFANNWVEKFKLAAKKSTQKSKSLRRELYSQSQDD